MTSSAAINIVLYLTKTSWRHKENCTKTSDRSDMSEEGGGPVEEALLQSLCELTSGTTLLKAGRTVSREFSKYGTMSAPWASYNSETVANASVAVLACCIVCFHCRINIEHQASIINSVLPHASYTSYPLWNHTYIVLLYTLWWKSWNAGRFNVRAWTRWVRGGHSCEL